MEPRSEVTGLRRSTWSCSACGSTVGLPLHRIGLRLRLGTGNHLLAQRAGQRPLLGVAAANGTGAEEGQVVVALLPAAVLRALRIVLGVRIGHRAPAQRRRRGFRREAIAERRDCLGLLHAEAEHARAVAHGAAAPPADLFAHHGRMLAAIALIDVLEHPLPLAMRDIEVDIGRLRALLAQEALEEEVHLHRIDRRDAETVADDGVGGGTATLAEDATAPREAHDIPHDEEEAGQLEARDDGELVGELGAVRLFPLPSSLFPISQPLLEALHRQALEILILSHARWQGKRRQRGAQLPQPEGASLGDGARGAHPVRGMAPAARHLCRRLEVPLAVGTEARAHLVEGGLVPQCREHVVHPAILRAGIVHVIRHDPRHAEPPGEGNELRHDLALLGKSVIPALDDEMVAVDVAERTRGTASTVNVTGSEERRHPSVRTTGECGDTIGMTREQVERHGGLAPRAIHARAGDEGGNVGVTGAGFGQQDHNGETGTRPAAGKEPVLLFPVPARSCRAPRR